MSHWVQLLIQPGQQRSVSAPASSSGSSNSAKRCSAALSNSQPSDVKVLTSKLDKLASTVKLLAEKSSAGGQVRDRSRSPRVSQRKISQGKGSTGKARGNTANGKGKGSRYDEAAQRQARPQARRTGSFKFQDEKCQDQGCVRAHVCAGCGRNAPWIKCKCINFD